MVVGQGAHHKRLKKCLISNGSEKTEIAGITGVETFGVAGMGGIGKTTLARSLYEDLDIKNHYDHRVYWVVVKRNPDINECQKQLIYDLCKEMPLDTLHTEEHLQAELKSKLSKMKRILLFLDDVWEKDHVDRLLGESFIKTLPPRSKCVITSRKPAELAKLDENAEIEKLDILSNEDSRILFCYKAFSRKDIPSDMRNTFKDVVNEVITACGNMPILLATVGAERWSKTDIKSWKKVRDRLRNAKEGREMDEESAKLIEQVKISYDDLPESDPVTGVGINYKDYFLDFAAFPEREEIEIAMLMDLWTKPELSEDGAYRILEQLEQRCLVRIDGYWCYVHDIFRALAIHLVEKTPIKERKRLFAWGMKDRLPNQWSLDKKTIFHAEKMVIARSDIKIFCDKDSILFTGLAHLHMLVLTSNLNLLSLPSTIGCMTTLEKLDISWCLTLEYIPKEIGYLTSLQKLNMAGCCSLKELPSEIGNLQKLLELNMQSCGVSNLPLEIGKLTSLTYMCLNDCNELQELPMEIGNLSNLEKLDCDMLQVAKIPESLGNLTMLKHISFGACGQITRIPVEFEKLKNLVFLHFVNSTNLEVVPIELDVLVTKGHLTYFNVYNTKVKHDTLPPNLRNLERPFDGNPRDPEAEATPDNPNGAYWSHRRGQLINPASIFNPGDKDQRRVSFGLARMVALAKMEPFQSKRFDMAIRIMYTMANYTETRHAILKYGGIPVLLRCIEHADPNGWVASYAAATICNICVTFSTHKAIVDARGLEILTRALHYKNHFSSCAFQALSWIWDADNKEHDYAFTSEIYERCGHTLGHLGCACIWCQHWYRKFLTMRNTY